ncbi:MAG TPA: helix-turn-helix transcriptional regulator [Phenylobacterium sp.]|uniref:helix-turn-helix transcriptional regulator n=1 Tax=Phenylobacterium sp. TaxID=1871053 RepID=UPI002B46C4D1|nr:helix-turn-helix transcriptional regulator [Phenylobacterium sp.]HKR86805.1 helix-turn-helix transcriptional regulator [Phenylobacterium sp.]
MTMQMTDDQRGAKLSLLTVQERECLRLVGLQLSSKEIAGKLGISKASVDTYCNRARAKLGSASRRDAAQLVRSLEADIARPAVEPPAPAHLAADPPAARIALLPPIASLGMLERCGLIVGGAAALTLAFGMLLSGLQSLNDAVGGAQAHAQDAQVRTAPRR